MSTERQLSALLHELQHARSPLAQARALARAWRTLRQLSPTDRRLLARHVSFDGAEEILEGLSRRGGLAPAMLLRVLANARSTDSAAVSELLSAVRDPDRRDEAISLGAGLASELLAEPEPEASAEVGSALEELWAVESATDEETEAEPATAEPADLGDEEVAEVPAATATPAAQAVEQAESGQPEAEPGPAQPPAVDWSRWRSAAEDRRPDPAASDAAGGSAVSDDRPRRFEARAVMGAMGAAESPISQLRVLRRELAGFAGSSLATLRELVESFPDGWARRRALCALLEAGIPSEADEALELIALFERELDRRWCLGVLVRRDGLAGSRLERALDLVSSPTTRRRIRAAARS